MQVYEVPEIEIDLSLPERLRWQEAAFSLGEQAAELAESGLWDMKQAARVAGLPSLHSLFSRLYRAFGGLYFEEMKSWADYMGVSVATAVFLNCTYELCAYGEYLGITVPGIIGCTSGIHYVPGKGMVHIRNMDWPIEEIGESTAIFRFTEEGREFVSVGMAGMVNSFSGMVPGKFSVTINWAPTNEHPGFDLGPAFLLREVFSECDSYDEAVYSLSHTEISAPCFYSVCGTDDACVIERTRSDYSVREYDGDPLVQANHYVTDELFHLNLGAENAEVLEGSVERMKTLESRMRRMPKGHEAAACRLDVEPVLNEDTHQQMVFIPATGEYAAWGV